MPVDKKLDRSLVSGSDSESNTPTDGVKQGVQSQLTGEFSVEEKESFDFQTLPIYARDTIENSKFKEKLIVWWKKHCEYNREKNEFIFKELPSENFMGFAMEGKGEGDKENTIEGHKERLRSKGYQLPPDVDYKLDNVHQIGLYPEDSPYDAVLLSIKQEIGVSDKQASALFGKMMGMTAYHNYATNVHLVNHSDRMMGRGMRDGSLLRSRIQTSFILRSARGYRPL